MKKIIAIILALLTLINIFTAFAKVEGKYTFNIHLEYERSQNPQENSAAKNNVDNNLKALKPTEFTSDFNDKENTEDISISFDYEIDKDAVLKAIKQTSQFEIKDSYGNIILDKYDLNKAIIYDRFCPTEETEEEMSEELYYDIDEYGNTDAVLYPKNPQTTTVLEFVLTSEGRSKLKEASSELVENKSKDNKLFIYINGSLLCTYKAKRGNSFIAYIGSSDKEHTDIALSLSMQDKYLIPKKIEITEIKPVEAYEINCSPWAYEYVENMIALGIINGDSRVDYKEPVTRLEFCEYATGVIMVQGKADYNINEYNSEFKDTKNKKVAMLNKLGIINGKGDGIFAPNDNITREEASAILVRMFKLLTGVTPLGGDIYRFNDHESISDWAKESVYAAYNSKIMTGIGDNIFNPQGTFTREQSFVTFKNIMIGM